MKRNVLNLVAIVATMLLLTAVVVAQDKKGFQEVYTGTLYGMSGGGVSTGFNLSIKDYTSDEEVQQYLATLAEGDQDDVLKKVRDLDLGRLSVTGHTGRNLIIVRKGQMPDGKIRIAVAFERWQTIREVRGGYRSQDYPWGLMEIVLNADGKKGSGTFIAACKIDLKRDKKTGKYSLEVENFGTYPHKVMGVMKRS